MVFFLRFQKWLFHLLQRFMREFIFPYSINRNEHSCAFIYLVIFKKTLQVSKSCPELNLGSWPATDKSRPNKQGSEQGSEKGVLFLRLYSVSCLAQA